jgi:hypothetical protein
MVRPRLKNLVISGIRGIAGPEYMAQTDVRQDGADYNRGSDKWKD